MLNAFIPSLREYSFLWGSSEEPFASPAHLPGTEETVPALTDWYPNSRILCDTCCSIGYSKICLFPCNPHPHLPLWTFTLGLRTASVEEDTAQPMGQGQSRGLGLCQEGWGAHGNWGWG